MECCNCGMKFEGKFCPKCGFKVNEDNISSKDEEENCYIDELKRKLLKTKSQVKRQEIIKQFDESILTNSSTKDRYNKLKCRVYEKKPLHEKIKKVYGFSVLIICVVNMILMIFTNNFSASTLSIILSVYVSIGGWTWVIWSFVYYVYRLINKSNYYLYIKDI